MYIIFANDSFEKGDFRLRYGETLAVCQDEQTLFKGLNVMVENGIPATYMTIEDSTDDESFWCC